MHCDESDGKRRLHSWYVMAWSLYLENTLVSHACVDNQLHASLAARMVLIMAIESVASASNLTWTVSFINAIILQCLLVCKPLRSDQKTRLRWRLAVAKMSHSALSGAKP